MAVLTLLTDFGSDDYYVAAVKGVVLGLAPGSTLVDVVHSVPAGDVEAGAFLLAAASRWFPAGTVHLAVVDPGVGGDRRILAARAGGAFFVGPDNGLLTGVLAASGTVAGDAPTQAAPEIRAVDRTDLYLPGPGSTFHGRDRFAPVAAYLLRGEPFAELGPPIDDPVRLPWEPPRCDGEPARAGAVLRGRVAWVDRFGNLVTDVPSDWLGDRPLTVTVSGPGETADTGDRATNRRADHFAAVPPGAAAAIPGSLGTLELAASGADLARRWRVERGAAVTVRLR